LLSTQQDTAMTRTLPRTEQLPYALYRAAQVRELDRVAIEEFGIPGEELMERAGGAAFARLRDRWPDARDVTVLAGQGNNGGDGFVLARHARAVGLAVRVLQVGDAERVRGDAARHRLHYLEAGGEIRSLDALRARTDVIVDGLFGTGLDRAPAGEWARAIDAANAHPAPVLALDVPSGLDADTGRALGPAIRAALTVTFIGLKQGLFTGEAPDHCGQVVFEGLEVPAAIYARQLLAARRIDWLRFGAALAPRERTASKGRFGHVLVIGGDLGMAGAARLAGEAALRAGAGLVSVATQPAHAPALAAARPELMARGIDDADELAPMLERATVVAIGPGLGRGAWGRALWARALGAGRPLVVDADALFLLSQAPLRRDDWVLTPHPGEAARLLQGEIAAVQSDRPAAAAALQQRYGGITVLKGAGTVVHGGGTRPPAICSAGNPGMATGGTGDVLCGLVAALIAQGHAPEDAAELGVCLHAAAGDEAARAGERGLIASDLFAALRPLLNAGDGR
jgi:NAD(P)H-hydrate epimerase